MRADTEETQAVDVFACATPETIRVGSTDSLGSTAPNVECLRSQYQHGCAIPPKTAAPEASLPNPKTAEAPLPNPNTAEAPLPDPNTAEAPLPDPNVADRAALETSRDSIAVKPLVDAEAGLLSVWVTHTHTHIYIYIYA